MADEVHLDMSGAGPGYAPRRKRRAKGDISRYWDTRYNTFLEAGFTPAEAFWGAQHGLAVGDNQVKKVIRARKEGVAFYMRELKDRGITREEAIEMCANDLDIKLENLEITEKNIFYEVSP